MGEAHSGRDTLSDFLSACGVTAHLAEVPQNRFEEVEALPGPARAREAAPEAAAARFAEHRPPMEHPEPAPSPPPAEVAGAVADAREAARQATDLAALRAALAAFDGCPLKKTAISTCPGEGPVGAPIMIVGEAPGKDEDAAGRPFVGRSGQLLEKMLRAIGFAREDVYISNVIPWRPPGNRTPSPIETATCEVFVRREIALVRPKILVPVGGAAAKTLLRTDAGIMSQRGRLVRYVLDEANPDDTIEAVATFHPAYLLRSPAEKRRAWSDLLAIRARLEEAHGLPPL